MQFYNLKIIKIFNVEKNIKKKSSYILSNNKMLLKNFFLQGWYLYENHCSAYIDIHMKLQ